MRPPVSPRFSPIVASFASVALALLVLSCGSERNSVEPELLGARVSASRVSLSVDGTGSTAGGVVTSDRGGISCTIAVSSSNVVSRSGKCAQDYKTGATITLTGTPANGGVVKSWVGCNGAAESAQACSVKLSAPTSVSGSCANATLTFCALALRSAHEIERGLPRRAQ